MGNIALNLNVRALSLSLSRHRPTPNPTAGSTHKHATTSRLKILRSVIIPPFHFSLTLSQTDSEVGRHVHVGSVGGLGDFTGSAAARYTRVLILTRAFVSSVRLPRNIFTSGCRSRSFHTQTELFMLLFVGSCDKSRNRQFALVVVCGNGGGHGEHVARSPAGSHREDCHVARNRAHAQRDHLKKNQKNMS